MKMNIRVLFYIMTLVSVIMFFMVYKYTQRLKSEPLVVIEGLHGSFILNGERFEKEIELKPGKYTVIGASVLRLFNGKTKVVKLPRFEVEVIWEK